MFQQTGHRGGDLGVRQWRSGKCMKGSGDAMGVAAVRQGLIVDRGREYRVEQTGSVRCLDGMCSGASQQVTGKSVDDVEPFRNREVRHEFLGDFSPVLAIKERPCSGQRERQTCRPRPAAGSHDVCQGLRVGRQ